MKTVTPDAVLFYYDGIQIFSAGDEAGGRYIGTIVGTEGDYGRYLVTGVSPDNLHLFRSGAMCLRELLLASPADERFIAVASGKFTDPLRLTPLAEPLERTTKLLPQYGFFLEEGDDGEPVAVSSTPTPPVESRARPDRVTVSATIDTADAARRVFRRASELLADPDDWARSGQPRHRDGSPRRTLGEAIAKAAAEQDARRAFPRRSAAVYVLSQILHDWNDLGHYNDHRETTHQDILNLLHDAAVVCDYIIKR